MRPSGDHLLVLETRARREGTGLTSRDLIGRWQLHTVWPKGTARPAAFNSSLLRGLGAALAFTPLDTAPNAPLRITNTVSLGRLELSFVGQAELSGRRPLLRFHFEWLRLRLGERLLFERGLSRGAAQALFRPDRHRAAGWLAGGPRPRRWSGALVPQRSPG